MALSRRHEADRTVAVLMVIPALELAYPCSGCPKILERLTRVCWPVFQRLDKRLREWVVVADSRATIGRLTAPSLPDRQHGGYLHRAAIIRTQYALVRRNLLTLHHFPHYFDAKHTRTTSCRT